MPVKMPSKSKDIAKESPTKDEKHDNVTEDVTLRQILRETVIGYIFWTIFQALAPMIWYYPLQELEITGYEAFAINFAGAFLLGIPPVRILFRNRWVMAVARLAALACVSSFQAPTTLQRLVMLSVGTALEMMIVATSITSTSANQRCVTFWGLILGLFAFLVSRIWFTSFVPAWWNEQGNSAVIAVGAIAVVDKILSGDDGNESEPNQSKSGKRKPNWFLTSLGLAALLYQTCWVFGEVSVVTRWTVKGYPDAGPQPYPWSAVVLLALWFGTELSPCKHVTTNIVWWAIGTSAFYTLYFLDTSFAFAGGIVLAVYTMSLYPEIMDQVSLCPPGRTFGVTGLVFVAQNLFLVWCVAYNFVPGGEYTREHTGWLIGFTAFALLLAIQINKGAGQDKSEATVQLGKSKMPNGTIKLVLYLILAVGLCGFGWRYERNTIQHPVKLHPKADFKAAVWAYRFGYDNRGWPSLERAAQFLNDTGADFITLVESDASKPFLGNNDLALWLGERLGMYADFGPATRDHTWGNLILSKYPIVKSTHHLLPSPHGELAPAVTATIDYSGKLVDFVVVHMGNDRDVLDRELQAKFLSEELKHAKNSVVFLGYVTSEPGSRDYKQLTQHGNVRDIDEKDLDRWCLYILYRNLIRLGYARISHAGLTDTEVQMANFRIPEDIDNYVDNDVKTNDPQKVPEDVRFNPVFGKFRRGHNWEWKHSYHMDTPTYFIPKK